MNRNMKLASRILGTYAVIYVAYLYLPVLFLPLFSFNDSIYISFPLRGWTLKWYQVMLANEALSCFQHRSQIQFIFYVPRETRI